MTINAKEFIQEIGTMREEYVKHELESQKWRENMKETLLRKEQEFIESAQKSIDGVEEQKKLSIRAARIREISSKRSQIFPGGDERELFKLFNLVFKNLVRETHMLFDVRKQKLKGPYRFGSIVIGAFGFGIRENVNSRVVANPEEMRYVLVHKDEVMKELKELELKNVAASFHAFCEEVVNLQVFDVFMRVPFHRDVEVFSMNGIPGKVRTVGFSAGNNVRYQVYVENRDGTWSEQVIADGGRLMPNARSFASYYVMSPYIDECIDALEKEVIEVEKREAESHWLDRVKTKFGKILMLAGV